MKKQGEIEFFLKTSSQIWENIRAKRKDFIHYRAGFICRRTGFIRRRTGFIRRRKKPVHRKMKPDCQRMKPVLLVIFFFFLLFSFLCTYSFTIIISFKKLLFLRTYVDLLKYPLNQRLKPSSGARSWPA